MRKLIFISVMLWLLALGAISDSSNPDSSVANSKFKPGDRIWTITDVKVRSDPGLASAQIDSMADGNLMIKGNTGTVLDGPISKDDYNWWKVSYDIGITGWSAENYLEVMPDGPKQPDNFAQWSEDAIKWATDKDRIGSNKWNKECLRFVSNAFRQKEVAGESLYAAALDAARDLYRFTQEQGGWQHAPRGALIFFDAKGTNPYGHVGIYLGDGKNIVNAYGKVQEITIEDAMAKGDVGKYIGWSYPPEAWTPETSDKSSSPQPTEKTQVPALGQQTEAYGAEQGDDERNFVARVIFAEAGPSCSDNERELVASVMVGRFGHSGFDSGNLKTMYQVASQSGQFSCIDDPNNMNWAKSADPSKFSGDERRIWDQCYSLAGGDFQQHYGPSGRPLVYYHDKSIIKPSSWDNKYWSAEKELETDHFIFYSVIKASATNIQLGDYEPVDQENASTLKNGTRQELIDAIRDLENATLDSIDYNTKQASDSYALLATAAELTKWWGEMARLSLDTINSVVGLVMTTNDFLNPGGAKKALNDPATFKQIFNGIKDSKDVIGAISTISALNGLFRDAESYKLSFEAISKIEEVARQEYKISGDNTRAANAAWLELWTPSTIGGLLIPLKVDDTFLTKEHSKSVIWVNGIKGVRENVKKCFEDFIDQIPDPLPPNYDLTENLTYLKNLTRELRRVDNRVINYRVAKDGSIHNGLATLGLINEDREIGNQLYDAWMNKQNIQYESTLYNTGETVLSITTYAVPAKGNAKKIIKGGTVAIEYLEAIRFFQETASNPMDLISKSVDPLDALQGHSVQISADLILETSNLWSVSYQTLRYLKSTFTEPLGNNESAENESEVDLPKSLAKPLESVFVLDNSGSMGCQGNLTESKIKMSKDTAKKLVDFAEIYKNVLVAVVSFSSSAEVESGFSFSPNELKSQIDDISESSCANTPGGSGGTSFGSGLEKALSLYDNSEINSRKAIIFMSDGDHNQKPDPQTYVDRCRKSGIPIYTIGFGPDANESLLRSMADQTGGVYSFSNDILNFQNSMIKAFDLGAGLETEKTYNGTISEGETKTASDFNVPISTKYTKVLLNWPDIDPNLKLDLNIKNPEGQNLSADSPGIIYSGNASKPKYIIINDPLPGNWIVEVQAKEMSAGTTNFTITVDDYPIQNATEVNSLPAKAISYSDDFSDPRSGWPRYSTKDVTFSYDYGLYSIAIIPDNNYFIAVNEKQNLQNFVLEVKAAKEEGDKDSEYGLVFRYVDKDNFYRFIISGNGKYKFDGKKEGSWFTIIDWTKSSIIRKDNDENLLQMTADGGKFAFYINGIKIAEIFDNTFDSGQIGLVGVTDNGGNARFIFDDLGVWSIVPYQPFGSISVGDILYSDEFSKDENGWANYSNENVEYMYTDGRYNIKVIPKNTSFFAMHKGDDFKDFAMEIEAAKIKGYGSVAYGTILRYVDNSNFYRFCLTSNGYFRFDIKKDGSWFKIIDWTKSDVIKTDKVTNIIQVKADGEKFTFYINGIEVAEAYDGTLSSGAIGLVAETPEDYGEALVSYDNLRVWSLRD